MDDVVSQSKRILKPTGSAVFILQPNMSKVGSVRLWLWKFLLDTATAWNLIQDAYWWNYTTPPTVHCQRKRGLLRPSVKYCLWFGDPNCYRNQEAVLWASSDYLTANRLGDRALRKPPSGGGVRKGRVRATQEERGGSTPFNLIPLPNTDRHTSSGAFGHGAGTPYKLCDWWTRYLTRPGDTILDPFSGAGTVGLAARDNGRNYIGIEQSEWYCKISEERLKDAR